MTVGLKKALILNLPYLLFVYLFDKLCQAVRLAPGLDASEKFLHLSQGFTEAFSYAAPSLHPLDLLAGIAGVGIVRLAVYAKSKNTKKYRKGVEYGSARWGTAADIAPYVDPIPDWNIPLTQTEILPIDLLIAQSIKSSKSGSPQEDDTNLNGFLEYYPLICTSSWEDQLFILQKVFAYLKMYSQERKVLEFLVKNNIPRTEQIDRRLNFLKNLNQNDISNAANSIEEFSIQTSDNEIAYDYRFISWTVSEINSYMNLLTSEDKTLDLPMVVAEWNKKIPQKNIRWSTDAMQVYLDKYLHENFGDLYTTKIKNCGAVLSNEVEYEPSVYIEATDSAKYPWLSFVVTGEQLTMTQVSFAIYALYLPTKDSQCTQAAVSYTHLTLPTTPYV